MQGKIQRHQPTYLRLLALVIVSLVGATMLLQPSPVQAGIYNSDSEVTYKEYWSPHTYNAGANLGWDGGCPSSGERWYIEPEGEFSVCAKTIKITIPDTISSAARAELFLDLWRNHNEMTHRFQINGGVTQYTTVGREWTRTPFIVSVPIGSGVGQIHTGDNYIKFFYDGSHRGHIHDIALRVYYDAGHPITGSDVSAPDADINTITDDNGPTAGNAGGSLQVNNNKLTFALNNIAGNPQFIEIHGLYEGYDEDADGNFYDWHSAPRMNCHPGGVQYTVSQGEKGCLVDPATSFMSGTIGIVGVVNPSVTTTRIWDVGSVINQAGVKFKLRVVDAAGNVREKPINAEWKIIRAGLTAAYINPAFQDAGLYMGGGEVSTAATTVTLGGDLTPYNKAYLIGAFWRNPIIQVNTNSQTVDAFKRTEDIWQLSVRDCANNSCTTSLISRLSPTVNTFTYSHRGGFGEFIEYPGPMVVLRGSTSVSDNTPPVLSGQNPADGATAVLPTTSIVTHVTDPGGYGVDRTSLVLRVNGNPVTPKISGFANDYILTYTPAAPFAYSSVVSVEVDACDLKNNCANNLAYSFTIKDQDVTAPLISNVQVFAGSTSAKITWTTDEPAHSVVSYGATESYTNTVTNNALVIQHTITLGGLNPGALYHYQIQSADADANLASTLDALFATGLVQPITTDTFNVCELNTNLWEFVNPKNDATLTLLEGNRVKLTVPGGVAHDIWKSQNPIAQAPRLMQDATIPAGFHLLFERGPAVTGQTTGILFQQDAETMVRVDFAFDGVNTLIEGFKIFNDNGVIKTQSAFPAEILAAGVVYEPIALSVTYDELTTKWRFYWDLNYYKSDGHDGSTAFMTYALAVTKIGFFAGNAGNPAPAHEVVVDWVSYPLGISGEDDTTPLYLPTSASPIIGGTVSKEPACGGPVTLTATANPGYSFAGWQYNGVAGGTENPKTVTTIVSGDSYVATFSEVRYTLTVDQVGQGNITVNPQKSNYAHGEQVTLTATPANGWSLSGWDGGLFGNPLVVTMAGNTTITATFTPIQPAQYTLTILKQGEGTLVANPQKSTYTAGEQVTLTATPATGYFFKEWTGGATGSSSVIAISMTGNKSVTGTFDQSRYSVAVSPGVGEQGASVMDPNQPTYLHGEQVQLTATPAAGWRFAGWNGDLMTTTVPALVNVTSNKAIYATFVQNCYVLEADASGNGLVTVSPEKPCYSHGDQVALTAQVGMGSTFSGWVGALTSDQTQITLDMDSDKLITAYFVAQQFTLSTAVNQQGAGSISTEPNDPSYNYGQTVELTANPADGWFFAGWEGDLVTGANPVSLIMTSTKQVTARFTQQPYLLNVSAQGSGTVAVNPQAAAYVFGDKVTLLAVGGVGSNFIGWDGDAKGSTNPLIVTINGNKNIIAKFTGQDYTLTLNPAQGGVASANPQKSIYKHGDSVQLTATPSAGYKFIGWSGDLSGATNPVTIVMDGIKSIKPNFAPEQYTIKATKIGRGTLDYTPTMAVYVYGTPITFKATPKTDKFVFVEWRGDLTGKQTPVTINVTKNLSVTAVFADKDGAPQNYEITTGVVGNGNVTLNPQKSTYNTGDTVTLTAVADSGWHFVAWSGDHTGATTPVGLTIQSDLAITATFAQDGTASHELTINVVGGGLVQRSPQKDQYDTGERVQLTVQPGQGWYFVGWSGALGGADNPATITMDGTRVITATFAEGIGVSVQGSDGGTVETSPAPPYATGQQVTVTATANVNYKFTGWLIDGLLEAGGQAGAPNPVRTIIVPDSKVYQAQFGLIAPVDTGSKIYLPVVMN